MKNRRLRSLINLLIPILFLPLIAHDLERETLRWGSLTITFRTDRERDSSICRITDTRGRVLRELRAPRFLTPSLLPELGRRNAEYFLDLNGDGKPALRLRAWTGGAYAAYEDYVFTYDPARGLRNVLIFQGGEGCLGKEDCGLASGGAPVGLRDLDGDGRMEILTRDYGIHHLNGSTHGATTLLVLSWDGTRYQDRTQSFPDLARAQAHGYQKRLEDALAATPTWCMEHDEAAAGYLAHATLANEEAQARSWLIAKGNEAREWLSQTGPEIHQALKLIATRIGQSQRRKITAFRHSTWR